MSASAALARPSILALRPYESARSLATEGSLFLDANEAPSGPALAPELNRYPEPQPRALLERLSRLYGTPSSRILVGRGTDEAIDLLVRVFCEPGRDRMLVCPPTYGMYEVSAGIQGVELVKVPLLLQDHDARIDEAALLGEVLGNEPRIKLVFLCSPNNPTGTAFDSEVLARICGRLEGRAIVVIDEAYAEFADSSRFGSMLPEIARFGNLVVLRTLSKAWAMAGARCGFALAQEPVISLLQKVRAPYPLSSLVIPVVLEGIDPQHEAWLQKRVSGIRIERERLGDELQRIRGVRGVYRSETNFLLVELEHPARLLARLRERGIVIRDRSRDHGLAGCVRITVGSESQNEKLLTALREALA